MGAQSNAEFDKEFIADSFGPLSAKDRERWERVRRKSPTPTGGKDDRPPAMRVYLDDIRPLPPGFDVVVRTSAEAIALLQTGSVTFLSLDHDLGTEDTGYTVARWIEQAAFEGRLQPPEWVVHSANPVGRSNIEMALRNAQRYWQQHHPS